MLAAMRHRGPDGGGVAAVPGAALGMVRLQVRPPATLELPPVAGGRAVAFNGEVYGRLPPGGRPVVTVADELAVLLGGPPGGVDGMWALVTLTSGGLVLSRDRWGLRPLYYAEAGGGWLVASELPALLPEAGRPAPVADLVTETLALGAPVTADTVYAGVASVPPGGAVELTLAGRVVRPAAPERPAPGRPADPGHSADPADPADRPDPAWPEGPGPDRLAAALSASVGRILTAERPVGLALSGGLDSSLVAHELVRRRRRGMVTVSVLVPGAEDGVRDAAQVVGAGAEELGWRHLTTDVDRYRYLDLLEPAVAAMGYPTRMSSAPLYLALAQRTAEAGVVVLLTGEGADELFLGYSSYARWAAARHEDPVDRVERVHLPARRRAHLVRLAGPDRVRAVRESYRAAARDSVADPQGPLRSLERRLSLGPLLDRADLCLMSCSLEGRAPFLHGDVPAIAASYPDAALLARGEGKAPLRQLARAGLGVPGAGVAKRPFRAPLRAWLREDDRRWSRAVRVRVRSGCRKLDYAASAVDALLAEAPVDDEAAGLVGALLAVDAWAALP
jgi:asparagine synthase (glutamine-hydrolysing)